MRELLCAYCLPYELASSITLFGKSSLRKRQLTKFRHLYGAVLRGDHWITIFVDLELSTFYYIDSFGTTSEAMQQAFANWLKFVKLRTDLLELHNEQPFAPVLVEHPLQKDVYNCGVFVCKFVSMLLRGENIKRDSFDPRNTIAELRSTILA